MNNRLTNGFGMVSNAVIRNPDISLRAKALYGYLASYADADTGQSTVSVNRIASECGIGVSTVKRILSELVKQGVIRRSFRGLRESHITTLLK
jgi:DNA-binding MarR family transcriptional regulator